MLRLQHVDVILSWEHNNALGHISDVIELDFTDVPGNEHSIEAAVETLHGYLFGLVQIADNYL